MWSSFPLSSFADNRATSRLIAVASAWIEPRINWSRHVGPSTWKRAAAASEAYPSMERTPRRWATFARRYHSWL